MSLVAEQLISHEEITGWKVALKEIHAALNKQVRLTTLTAILYYFATLSIYDFMENHKFIIIKSSFMERITPML